MKEIKGKKWDNNITAVRVIFLLSIVAAHSSITREEASSEMLLWRIWQVWSLIGVPGFFILSGYLFKGKSAPLGQLWLKKWKSVITPWLICGSLIYLITQIGEYSRIGYLKFLLGHGSFLYYMSTLCVCFLLFYLFHDNTAVLFVFVALNCTSLILTQYGIYKPIFTNFLNIANWFGYFAFGCLIREYGLLEKSRKTVRGNQIILALAGLIAIVCGVLLKVETYFYLAAFPIGCICFFSAYCLCILLKVEQSKIMRNIGTWSFSIYLLHMPVAAALKRVVRMVNLNLYVLIPVITIALFWMVLGVLDKLGSKNKIMDRITFLIGMR